MTYDPHDATDLARRAGEIVVSDLEFAARVAIGVRNKPRNGKTTWAVLVIEAGLCHAYTVAELPSDALPEDKLGVVLAVAATTGTWSSCHSEKDFLAAIAEQKFYITGEAPFWIRHLSSVLELLKPFR